MAVEAIVDSSFVSRGIPGPSLETARFSTAQTMVYSSYEKWVGVIGNKLGDMKVDHYEKSAQNRVDMPGATGCKVRKLIGAEEQAPNFAMRQFEVEPGGFTPRHCHPYEHEVFVLEGTGVVFEGDQQHPIRPGDVIYVAPNEIHQFRNPGENSLKFLCLIPNSASNQKVTPIPECGEI